MSFVEPPVRSGPRRRRPRRRRPCRRRPCRRPPRRRRPCGRPPRRRRPGPPGRPPPSPSGTGRIVLIETNEQVGEGGDRSSSKSRTDEYFAVPALAGHELAHQLRHHERPEQAADAHREAGERVLPLVQARRALQLVLPAVQPEVLRAHAAEVQRYGDDGQVLHGRDVRAHRGGRRRRFWSQKAT